MTVEPLLTTSEVARLLGVDEKTVRAEVRSGRLARILIGKRSVRFHPGDVNTYFERVKECRSINVDVSGTINSTSTDAVIAGPQGRRRKAPHGKSKTGNEIVQGPWVTMTSINRH